MNNLQVGNNELVYVDYSDLLNKILQVLRNQQPQKLFKISSDQERLLIDIDAVATQMSTLQVDNPLGAFAKNVKVATVHFSPGFKELFPSQIQEIANCLKQSLESVIHHQQSPVSIKEFVENLVTSLQIFKGEKSSLNLTYPFPSYQGLQKQRLTFLDKNTKGKELLRTHKLTITVQKTREFNQELWEGLEKYTKLQFASATEEEREDLSSILEDLHKQKEPDSDIYRLKRIVDTQTLGKLKKQAQINYLEFLYENINTDTSSANAEGAIYLKDMIRRLRLIEEYINDVNKADGDYLVTYAGHSLNLRDIFSRGEAFDMLPIIPKVEGYLGETKNEIQGEIQFVFGLKLKFDGRVHTDGGKTVFEHYLNLLNPDSEQHKAELTDPFKKETFAKKILKILFLYYILFAYRPDASSQNSELTYNPITGFNQKAMPILKGDDDAAKQNLFRNMLKGFDKFNAHSKIKTVKEVLLKVIKSTTKFSTRDYPLHISVNKGILEQEINNILKHNTFFKPVLKGNPKEVLKYISIGEANAKVNALYSLPAKISISDIHYATTNERQSFCMEYDNFTDRNVLPLLFLPFQNQTCQKIYNENFKQRKLVLFPYKLEGNRTESQQAFVYQFTFALLAYICLKVLLHQQKRLFIPILRLHLHTKEDDAPIEKFIVSLSNVLSHLLNEKYLTNPQGVDIRDLSTKGKFKIPNFLSSLYSVLPKRFTFPNTLDCPHLVTKLVMIIISSRECDRGWNSTQKQSNLMGEILELRYHNDAVIVQLLKTFTDNYERQQMFKNPDVVIDEVSKLYGMGYRHFVYIAKAPYSSTLHMNQTEDDGLFFMSKEILKAFKTRHSDIKIYPIYFDKYYAINLHKLGFDSLYIQDTAELTNLVDDPSQKSVVFFNLFNGNIVGKKEERHYNGVISYATLLRVYEGIIDDEDIYKGLIFKSGLKNDILQYLTLFHFSRYEKSKQINLKLDPYENLIGEKSVGALSLLNHMRGKGEFNLLAFLTEVKKVLNLQLKSLFP